MFNPNLNVRRPAIRTASQWLLVYTASSPCSRLQLRTLPPQFAPCLLTLVSAQIAFEVHAFTPVWQEVGPQYFRRKESKLVLPNLLFSLPCPWVAARTSRLSLPWQAVVAMALIGTSTIVFPKLDSSKDASGKNKRTHVCNVCSRAFKRSEHCIRHQRGRKLNLLSAQHALSSLADKQQIRKRNHLGAECVDDGTVAGISDIMKPKVTAFH